MEKTNLIFVGEHGFAWIGEKVPGKIPVEAVKWAPIPAIGALGWSNNAPQGVQQCLVAYRYNVSGKKEVGLVSRRTPIDTHMNAPVVGPEKSIIAFWPLHQLEWTEFPKPESGVQDLLTVEQAKHFAKDLMSSGDVLDVRDQGGCAYLLPYPGRRREVPPPEGRHLRRGVGDRDRVLPRWAIRGTY